MEKLKRIQENKKIINILNTQNDCFLLLLPDRVVILTTRWGKNHYPKG
jgi:hypothetical protein